MPQMAPINWLILFILFITIYMLTNMLMYFLFNYTSKFTFFKKKKILNSWKW
uniref:ATP synthase F0 subunit 8 n=1 Tax=Cucujoidea sp. 13 KM-2017 TaxID=2219349 RepID=A0A346RJZ4_9CUCU|nr:ATP synthase F0 subunit 8 [Cucujoidea sp. 13 KM-2017]